jgi:hypothetical protein
MPAAIHNITIEAGATFRLEVTWKDAEEEPVDLTGYTAQAQVRKGLKGDVLLEFTSANESIELGGESGKIVLLATPVQTRAVQRAPREGVWDLELTNPGGEVTRLLKGKARFSAEVTR